MLSREKTERPDVIVDDERCNLCGLCVDIGCPAIVPGEDAVCVGDACTGCGLCIEVCRRGALSYAGGKPAPTRRSPVVNGTASVSLVGVGGQGILLAAAVLAKTAMAEGLDVKVSEVKGMAQRGGRVLSTVRFGAVVWSPVAPHADVIIATEAARRAPRASACCRRGGALVCATTTIAPGSVLRARAGVPATTSSRRPPPASVRLSWPSTPRSSPARPGTVRAANIVLLGAASTVLPFTAASWQRGLEAAVPAKILVVNQRAFDLGRDAVQHS